MELTWLSKLATRWRDQRDSGRLPHAVLMAGPKGVGKRAAAAWMVGEKLALSPGELPVWPLDQPEHADLHWLTPPEDKNSIGIDQVRALVDELNLTSYSGHGKAAVIEPAQLMTHNAANSLLKTLEEPPGDTLLVLVADRTGSLPATILSRCQRIDVRAPNDETGLAWLDRLRPGENWADALRMAGGAPLAAIEVAEQLDRTRAMAEELKNVGIAQSSPVDVAASWARQDPIFVLEWLARQVQAAAKANTGDREALRGTAIDDSVLKRMDSRNLFCYLDNINRLRGQARGSYNVQLALESLLIDWATGLRDVDTPAGFKPL
jgi:DNA polymerase-3 subunit delta'